jgi:hypothetical protein
LLSEEIIVAIRKCSSNLSQTDSDLKELRELSYRDRSPEAEYAILLFRKYEDMISKFTHQNEEQTDSLESPLHSDVLDRVYAIVFGSDPDSVSGVQALKSRKFWLRAIAALLALVSFTVMSTVQYISEAKLNPTTIFAVRNI